MFEYLGTVGAELHGEMLKIYWVLIVPFILLLFVLELLRDENPNVRDILYRTVISLLMLLSFDWCLGAIATVGDAVVGQIGGLEKLSDVIKQLGPNTSGHDSWFNLRETTIYIFGLAAYIVAYVGFFTATALTHFVWTVLYICSPLMILMFVSRYTAHVTSALYRGLIQVVIWKVLWSLLGVLLLKLSVQPDVSGMEDYLMAIVMNLCIGVSMLFIPIATKSIVSDGMNSVATSLAMAPAIAAAGAAKVGVSRIASKAASGVKSSAALAARPVKNHFVGRYQTLKAKVKPKVDRLNKNYSKPETHKEKR